MRIAHRILAAALAALPVAVWFAALAGCGTISRLSTPAAALPPVPYSAAAVAAAPPVSAFTAWIWVGLAVMVAGAAAQVFPAFRTIGMHAIIAGLSLAFLGYAVPLFAPMVAAAVGALAAGWVGYRLGYRLGFKVGEDSESQ